MVKWNRSLRSFYCIVKLGGFIKKLNIWKQKIENDSFEMFLFTEEFLANNDVESNAIKPLVIVHLPNLSIQF